VYEIIKTSTNNNYSWLYALRLARTQFNTHEHIQSCIDGRLAVMQSLCTISGILIPADRRNSVLAKVGDS